MSRSSPNYFLNFIKFFPKFPNFKKIFLIISSKLFENFFKIFLKLIKLLKIDHIYWLKILHPRFLGFLLIFFLQFSKNYLKFEYFLDTAPPQWKQIFYASLRFYIIFHGVFDFSSRNFNFVCYWMNSVANFKKRRKCHLLCVSTIFSIFAKFDKFWKFIPMSPLHNLSLPLHSSRSIH